MLCNLLFPLHCALKVPLDDDNETDDDDGDDDDDDDENEDGGIDSIQRNFEASDEALKLCSPSELSRYRMLDH